MVRSKAAAVIGLSAPRGKSRDRIILAANTDVLSCSRGQVSIGLDAPTLTQQSVISNDHLARSLPCFDGCHCAPTAGSYAYQLPGKDKTKRPVLARNQVKSSQVKVSSSGSYGLQRIVPILCSR